MNAGKNKSAYRMNGRGRLQPSVSNRHDVCALPHIRAIGFEIDSEFECAESGCVQTVRRTYSNIWAAKTKER